LFRARKKLGRPPCGGSIDKMRTQPPSRYAFKMEVLRGPPIRERDFKAPAQRDSFMLDDSDAGGHDAMIARALADGQRAKRKGKKFGRPERLDAGQKRVIAELHGKGKTIPELAAEYEVGVGTIWRALNPFEASAHA
jgi:hypothetical protein